MNDKERRMMPLFSIGIVMKLTELTARQIRYYEEHKLIFPERTSGNQRLFSFNDVDRLLEIKKLLDNGLNLTGIKLLLDESDVEKEKLAKIRKSELTEKELRTILKNELSHPSKLGKTNLRQGELARFFSKH
ncbi:MerR family transcriptional regulator [Oceanobacillus bengalensis]|uniref:MerR family transcriptional regulator n=1 Tax=Oceanobacillus bengalensis TaxID=1435466 RepID=A0A494Z492_9BACI|nr:MerR family transcriptional regulator [Oceanobacillus bengalensis]RKQ17293.1 MerR family transcriptional regulator [Oceanobacillus bengalensis]